MGNDYYSISIEGKIVGYLETETLRILDVYDRAVSLEKIVRPEKIGELKNLFQEKLEISEIKK